MSIGFKEWALVCSALGNGTQSVILRKGGIAEGREGFRFQHESFFLFPTLFHEQVSRLKLPAETAIPAHPEGQIAIQYCAKCEWTELITDWEVARALDPFHVWKEEVIRQRFDYDEPKGLSLAFVRVFKLGAEWVFPDSPAYGGCRSWVELPEPPTGLQMEPVISDEAHADRAAALRVLLGKR